MVGKVGTLPGNVPSFDATEAGGKVYARWGAATDLDTLDYELRYGAVGVAWDSATYIQRIAALAYTIEGMLVTFGVNGTRVFRRLHEANMAKVGVGRDASGKLLHHTVLHATAGSNTQLYEAAVELTTLIKKYSIESIAIGNGTASRETEA
jgi:hypothetical protein